MKVLIILGHPSTDSFNHAIAETCCKRLKENGHTVMFHDLYREGFNPVIESGEIPRDVQLEDELVRKHCRELINSDGIIIVHPNWWGQPPAIVKGWIDRVIRPGIAYKFKEGDSGEGVPVGLLKAKAALVFNTSNTSEKRENSIFKDPLETIWRNCIFDFCGVKQFSRKIFRIVVTSDLQQRRLWLAETEQAIDRYFPKEYPDNKIKINGIYDLAPGVISELLRKSYAGFIDSFPGEKKSLYSQWEKEDHAAFTQKQTIGRCAAFTCLNGLPIGYFSWDDRQFPVGIIGQNCICPEYQGQGFGTCQVEWIVDWFRERDFCEIRVTTGDHDFFLPARMMYKKCGFVEKQRTKGVLFSLIEFTRKLQ